MFDGPEPIYIQIATMLRQQILSGDLAEGDQVMSTTQFAQQFTINPATAQKAFGLLVDEGLIEKRRGRGMFVAPGARAKLLLSHRQDYFTKVLGPALAEARVLGIGAGELIEFIRMEDALAAPGGPATPATGTPTAEAPAAAASSSSLGAPTLSATAAI